MQPNSQDLPPEAQNKIETLQNQKEKLQQIAERKYRFKVENKRIESGIDALEEAGDKDEVFKVVGPVGIKTEKNELKEELSNEKEKLEAQIDSMEDKQDYIEEKAKKNQSELREMLSGGQEPR